ncbi:hemerythrin domain-containing protein [Aridibaculum aurantiacum]|uniref:hemerythrin domain-containing protein n=1 Tax=Aridibaculum aurantiacum TaxID=2810307 RepID=UPI001A96B691|nr:hemerythrin domain-containing protein [Aridibaculum aurantiacum]
MQRYNTFKLVHKALRALLYDTALLVQQTDFADATATADILERLEYVVHHFEQHAHHEDNYIQPAVAAFDPQLAAAFEAEHEEDEMLGNQLKALIAMYRSLHTAAERINCGSAISKSFVDFMIFNLQHMAKEESDQNQVLWQNYTDEQIMDISRQIVSKIPPAEMMVSAKWMLRGISNEDAVGWLKALKFAAPVEVYSAMLELAANELPVDRLEIILDAIDEEVLVA